MEKNSYSPWLSSALVFLGHLLCFCLCMGARVMLDCQSIWGWTLFSRSYQQITLSPTCPPLAHSWVGSAVKLKRSSVCGVRSLFSPHTAQQLADPIHVLSLLWVQRPLGTALWNPRNSNERIIAPCCTVGNEERVQASLVRSQKISTSSFATDFLWDLCIIPGPSSKLPEPTRKASCLVVRAWSGASCLELNPSSITYQLCDLWDVT
jgi:hypothetical protein